MKEFSYLKISIIILLMAVAVFGIFSFIASNHAIDTVFGDFEVHPGQQDVVFVINCTSKSNSSAVNYRVRVDDGNIIHGQLVNGYLTVPLHVELTYVDHYYMVDFWKNDPVWSTVVVPWDPVIATYNYYNFDNNTDLANVKIGNFHIPKTPIIPLPSANVTLHLDNGVNIDGSTDEQGFCNFDLSGVDFKLFKTGYVEFAGNETHSACRSHDVPISLVLDNINTTVNDTNTTVNDTNSTVNDTNSTVNDTNGSVDISNPLEDALTDIGESLPVTGIPVIVGLLACIASIFIIKRN
ncbi:MAG: hypothetical protein CfClM3_0406 [Methanobrevibacter sp. CfCl-M3]